MANKKIQIKNNADDSLFPVTKRACIDDFAHTHSFTGTAKAVSVSGTYSRATGVTINSITPTGSITLSRSANVALSTTSINQITGVGSLPTRESKTVVTSAINGASATFTGTVSAGSNTTSTGGTEYLEDATITGGGVTPTISYMHFSAGSAPTRAAVNVVTGVSGGGGSRTLSYLHYTAPSATKGSYTPAGSVTLSRSANVALSTSTISQITGVGSLPTRASFTYNTLTVSGTGDHCTLCVASASAYQITGLGSLPTKAGVSVATGVSTQPSFTGTFAGTATTALVTAVSGGSLTANTTSSGGIKVVSDASFTNASATTSTISQITGVGTNPSLTFNSTSSGGQAYVTNVTHTSPSLSKTTKYLHPTVSGSVNITTTTAPTTTVSSITGVGSLPTMSVVNVATGVSTQPNFTGTFRGTAVTPTGSITTSSTSLTLSGSYTPTGTVGDVQ